MELRRRELIAAFLGASVAAGCSRKSLNQGLVPGAVVDTGFATGHLLWKPEALPLASEARPVDVLIIGAGVAGLSAAWRLRAAGVENFAVVELEDVLGGTARSGSNSVSAWPWGAHYLPAPVRDAGPVVRLLKEVGIAASDGEGGLRFDEGALLREPQERIFFKGRWYEGLYLRAGASDEDLKQLARFEELTTRFAAARDATGRRAFALPVDSSSRDDEWLALDRLTFADWLDAQGLTSSRLRWLADYACRDDFGIPAAQTSAWAGLWYFTARHDGTESAGYLSWPEGNGRLVAELARRAGAERISRQVLAHTVTPSASGCRVDAFDAKAKTPVAFSAKHVVLAAPRFIAAKLVAPWRTSPPAWLKAFRYTPWVVANLTVKQLPEGRGFPMAWDNVFYESNSLGYVVATHQTPRAWDGGPSVLTWYYPLTGADENAERRRALSASYEDWATLVAADFDRAHPGFRAHMERLEVTRHGHAMVRPVPGFLFGGARDEAKKSVEGTLHFAHSDLGGLPLFEEACESGVTAAETVLAALGKDSSTWREG